MIEVRDVPRSAIDRGLKVARVPFDTVARLLPADGGPRDAAMLVIDRADATVRAAVGEILHDDDLRQDAMRRRAAADERQRAMELRIAAKAKQRDADSQLAEELEEAGRLRAQAAYEAQERTRQVENERAVQEREVRRVAAAQERAVEEARDERLATEEKRAKRQRLGVLDEEAAALDLEAHAIVATDEAQRLRDAAGEVKAARKGSA